MAKKSKSYAPYIYAFFQLLVATASKGSFFLPGYPLRAIFYFCLILGMWHLVQWLLSRSENKWVQWIYVIVGTNLYNFAWIGLDHYYLHILITVVVGAPEMIISQFLVAVSTTIVIESINWTKAREKAEIENLRLQAENIEAKFKLLKEQVNPEFLFYCLANLEKMVDANDPKTEENILKLADVYRQILKKTRNNVTLKEELAFLKTYLSLISYGREAAIQHEINVSEASLQYQLPVFALQSVVDKCLKHNDFSAENPLYIMIFQKDAQSITVSNNIQNKAVAKKINMEQLEMRYTLEGIENGVLIETETSTYSTTLKLF